MLVLALMTLLVITPGFSQSKYQSYIIDGKTVIKESVLEQFLKVFHRKPFQKSYAIIIAIGNYDNLPPLTSSRQDAEKMKETLLHSGEYDEIVILQDQDASYDNIRYFMQSYFPSQMMQPGRYRFLFYFTGHGGQYEGFNKNVIGLLLLKGAENRINTIESIDMRDLVKWSDRFQYASHVLFLLDSCFSGLAGTEVKEGYDIHANMLDLAEMNGRHMITAGSADQTSIANVTRWGGSLFTEMIVNGIKGRADSNKDGVVMTYELFNYVQETVRDEANEFGHKQTPLISNLGSPYKDTGQYFFVYREPTLSHTTAYSKLVSEIKELSNPFNSFNSMFDMEIIRFIPNDCLEEPNCVELPDGNTYKKLSPVPFSSLEGISLKTGEILSFVVKNNTMNRYWCYLLEITPKNTLDLLFPIVGDGEAEPSGLLEPGEPLDLQDRIGSLLNVEGKETFKLIATKKPIDIESWVYLGENYPTIGIALSDSPWKLIESLKQDNSVVILQMSIEVENTF